MNKDLFSHMNRWIHFILQSMTISHFFSFFLAYFRNDMGKGSLLLLNVKWNTLSLTGKRIVCCFFTMHPSNRDHKDMQKRGVQTFQARVGSGGVGGIKLSRRDWQDMPGTISTGREDRQSEGSITFKLEEHCLLLHFTHTWDPEVRKSMKYLQVRCDLRLFSTTIPLCSYHMVIWIADQSIVCFF